jgi:Cft2 family RNA processing exonuclease
LPDPVSEAFRKVIQEIYWIEDLEEAERTLKKYLDMIDPDLREYLLEKREKLCRDPLAIIEVLRLSTAAEIADTTEAAKVLLTKRLVDSGFLLQCTPTWRKLSNSEKAKILVPLYKASYGLELALRDWPNKVDELHLDYALKMATAALDRAEEKGLLDEFKEYVDKIVEEYVGEGKEGLED